MNDATLEILRRITDIVRESPLIYPDVLKEQIASLRRHYQSDEEGWGCNTFNRATREAFAIFDLIIAARA